jgi:tyrosyl-DNA phosphodiesterase-1
MDAAQPVGHRKLRQAVIQHTTTEGAEKNRPIICQFSSIGSLTDKYLHELQASMDTGLARDSKQSVSDAPMRLQLVYPTIAEIRLSIEGYRGVGRCRDDQECQQTLLQSSIANGHRRHH